jgi:hypothetical protein
VQAVAGGDLETAGDGDVVPRPLHADPLHHPPLTPTLHRQPLDFQRYLLRTRPDGHRRPLFIGLQTTTNLHLPLQPIQPANHDAQLPQANHDGAEDTRSADRTAAARHRPCSRSPPQCSTPNRLAAACARLKNTRGKCGEGVSGQLPTHTTESG